MFYHWQSGPHQHLLKIDGPDVVRMVAHPSQVSRIEKYIRDGTDVELCSKNPLSADSQTSPSDFLEQMSKINLPPNRGGFMPASTAYRSSLIAGTYANNEPDEFYFQNIVRHPFIERAGLFCFNNCMSPALVLILNYIYDIRRFVDPLDGKSSLLSYFQLNDIKAFTELVINNNATQETLRTAIAYNATGLRNDACLPDGDPREFFRRDAEEMYQRLFMTEGLDAKESVIMSHYKATVKFMLYLEKVWTSGLGLSNFYPASFFKNSAVTEAYKASLK